METWQSSILLLAVALRMVRAEAINGIKGCQDSMDCAMLVGHICRNSQCICETDRDLSLFPCAMKTYGDQCRADYECFTGDINLVCTRTDTRRCRCRRGLLWDFDAKRCYLGDDGADNFGYLDPMRQMILPGVILITLGAMIYLGFKLFCNCGRRQRRRLPDMESQLAPQTTWVASYRVFSSVNGIDARTNQPFPSCLLLPIRPPSYEEALKHKVILSSHSYPNTNQHQSHHQPPTVICTTLPQPV
ncbi:uncharacterized protein LOC142329575 isoform X2 [Lycorma delicatula]|uniref:uncharacterized protein LOC142329575 isoform X2 n=1 Tax=Lycorma delicatula TaxID=130591 RepID=UPI003F511BBE